MTASFQSSQSLSKLGSIEAGNINISPVRLNFAGPSAPGPVIGEQLVRMIDADGKPIEGVDFRLQVATPSPFYNYLGIVDDAKLKTNSDGEAIYRWFPDWPEVHRYVELNSDQWFIHDKDSKEKTDDALVIVLKPHFERKRVTGRVIGGRQSLAGLTVELLSFQAEREDQNERLYATTDARGSFSANVLPGSTYSASVSDPKFPSDYADLIAFDPQTNKAAEFLVTLQPAAIAKVRLTAGPD